LNNLWLCVVYLSGHPGGFQCQPLDV